MNGLLSTTPSQSAIRLAISGLLLLLTQNLLLLLLPRPDQGPETLIAIMTLIAMAALVTALIGMPEPPRKHWRLRHDR